MKGGPPKGEGDLSPLGPLFVYIYIYIERERERERERDMAQERVC